LGGVAAAGVAAAVAAPQLALAHPAMPADNPGTFSADGSIPGHYAGVFGQGINNATGVAGNSDTNFGVSGVSSSGTGVVGSSPDNVGVKGASSRGIGVVASSDNYIALVVSGTGRFLQYPTISHPGPPTAADPGEFLSGERILDSNYALWLCTGGGIPGTWRQVAALAPGYAGGALNLLPVPIRLLDTRAGTTDAFTHPGAPIGYHGTLQMPAAGLTYLGQTIPDGATAVFGNLAVALAPGVDPGDGSSLICWPNGQARPVAVNLVYNGGDLKGEYTSTFTLVAIGTSNLVDIFSQPINAGAAVDVIFDAFGFVM
jgi:hypothetical protein